MIHRIRYVKPILTEWFEQEGSSFAVAVQQHHYDHQKPWSANILVTRPDGKREVQSFAMLEDDQGNQLISRVCSMGLYRAGGVKRTDLNLEWAARQLGVTVEELQEPWEQEEEYVSTY